MRYKSKVLARFPSARVMVRRKHDDGTPRYLSIMVGATWDERFLDIHDPAQNVIYQQGPAAAWRSAYYWCVRNPDRVAA